MKEKVLQILQNNPQKRFAARDIVEEMKELFPDWWEQLDSRRKHSGKKLESHVAAGVNTLLHHRKSASTEQIKEIEGWPRKFYWSDVSDESEADEAMQAEVATDTAKRDGDAPMDATRLLEKDLYPRLGEYLLKERRIHSMRIDEAHGDKKAGAGGNRWLYPDVVGMENLIASWSDGVKSMVNESGEKKARLWSFEVKRFINRANVRQAFFQAVSNSSWANFGYLVAMEIQGTDTRRELEMLSSLHGIGVIILDPDTPDESQIIIPAMEKADVDWATCDRVARANKDFERYIGLVWDFYRTNKTSDEKWYRPPK